MLNIQVNEDQAELLIVALAEKRDQLRAMIHQGKRERDWSGIMGLEVDLEEVNDLIKQIVTKEFLSSNNPMKDDV